VKFLFNLEEEPKLELPENVGEAVGWKSFGLD
jgi:hypothetical protein